MPQPLNTGSTLGRMTAAPVSGLPDTLFRAPGVARVLMVAPLAWMLILAGVSLIVLLRTLTGATTASLNPLAAVLLAGALSVTNVLAGVTWLAHCARHNSNEDDEAGAMPAGLVASHKPTLRDRLARLAPLTAMALLAVVPLLTVLTVSDWAAAPACAWLLILLVVVTAGAMFASAEIVRRMPTLQQVIVTDRTKPVTASDRSPPVNDDELQQWMRRAIDAAGADVLEGAISGAFAAGQKELLLHVPFVPPFAERPKVVCDLPQGAAARIKGTAVYAYGLRIELKRTDCTEPAPIRVHYSARST